MKRTHVAIGAERRLVFFTAPGPEAQHPVPEAQAAPEAVRFTPEDPDVLQTQVLESAISRDSAAMHTEFRRRDHLQAVLNVRTPEILAKETDDAVAALHAFTDSKINTPNAPGHAFERARAFVQVIRDDPAAIEQAVDLMERAAGAAQAELDAGNVPAGSAREAQLRMAAEVVPIAAALRRQLPRETPAQQAAGDVPSRAKESGVGFGAELPQADRDALQQRAEGMLNNAKPEGMNKRQADLLMGRVMMTTGVSVAVNLATNAFDITAPTTPLEKLMNHLSGAMQFIMATFDKKEDDKTLGEKRNEAQNSTAAAPTATQEAEDVGPVLEQTPEAKRSVVEEARRNTLEVLQRKAARARSAANAPKASADMGFIARFLPTGRAVIAAEQKTEKAERDEAVRCAKLATQLEAGPSGIAQDDVQGQLNFINSIRAGEGLAPVTFEEQTAERRQEESRAFANRMDHGVSDAYKGANADIQFALKQDAVGGTIEAVEKWGAEQVAVMKNWTENQWNAFTSSAEFIAEFSKDGVVNTVKLPLAIGQEAFNTLMRNAKTLVNVGNQILNSATEEGKARIMDAYEKGLVATEVVIGAHLYIADAVAELHKQAVHALAEAIEPGVRWTDQQIDAAKQWGAEQWDAYVGAAAFARDYVVDGVIDQGKLIADIGKETYEGMMRNAKTLVMAGTLLIDLATDAGKEALVSAINAGTVTADAIVQQGKVTAKEMEAILEAWRTRGAQAIHG